MRADFSREALLPNPRATPLTKPPNELRSVLWRITLPSLRRPTRSLVSLVAAAHIPPRSRGRLAAQSAPRGRGPPFLLEAFQKM